MNGNRNEQGLIPYSVIIAAKSGDSEAIRAILSHYSGYIAYLSTCKTYGKDDGFRCKINEELRERLKSKLIYAVLEFKI